MSTRSTSIFKYLDVTRHMFPPFWINLHTSIQIINLYSIKTVFIVTVTLCTQAVV